MTERVRALQIARMKAHYGAIARGEYAAASAEARMMRFSKAPGMRNMATLGCMDEIRHGQMQLYFPTSTCRRTARWMGLQGLRHQRVGDDRRAALLRRHHDDPRRHQRFHHADLQLRDRLHQHAVPRPRRDAAEAGDHTFANLISSIQTDESRHAQIGGPALKILIENGQKAEAQKRVDIAVWGAWKLFSVLTGPIMDYYTPLEHRKQSFKEFMEEWIVAQFERA